MLVTVRDLYERPMIDSRILNYTENIELDGPRTIVICILICNVVDSLMVFSENSDKTSSLFLSQLKKYQ